MDGDGDLDVLLGNYDSASRVLLNAGDGTFPTSIELPGGSVGTRSIAAADVDGDGDLDVLLGVSGSPSRLLPLVRCSQTDTARSHFGHGCVRCPAPISRRDDHFDICYECEEHTELNGRGECSSCKPGYERSLGAAECTACPRGESRATNLARDEQCPHAPPTPPAALVAAAHGTMLQPQIAAALTSSVALLIALLVVIACFRQRSKRRRMVTQLLDSNSVSMHTLPRRVPKLQGERPTSSLESSSVGSDEPTHLEVVDFSTLTLGRPIGKGGFATVWLARWQGNDLAVKVLNMEHENIDASPAQDEVIVQEVAILRRLRHPCICALFGHMRVDKRPALVLEYMAGGSLAAYLFDPRQATSNMDPPREAVQASASSLSSRVRIFRSLFRHHNAAAAPVMGPPPGPHLAGMLPCDKKIRFGVQLASGLCFLHSHGILHHDVKTDNALLDANHTVCKLADFGLASLSLKYVDRKRRYSVSAGGTLRYLAPEKLEESERHARKSRDRGDGRGSSSGGSSSSSLGRTLVSFEDRADVYAFALLLWELTHERRAFEGMRGVAAAFSASQGLRPQFLEPNLYGMIPAITAECWAQRPEDRPSMSTVLERLDACMQALSATQSVGDSSVQSSPTRLSSCSDESSTVAAVLFDHEHFSTKVGEHGEDIKLWVEPERDREKKRQRECKEIA